MCIIQQIILFPNFSKQIIKMSRVNHERSKYSAYILSSMHVFSNFTTQIVCGLIAQMSKDPDFLGIWY